MKSTVSGIVESVNISSGDSVNKGDVILKVYPKDSMYIEFSVNETDLDYVHEGDEVEIEFLWNEGEAEKTVGRITFISLIAQDANASYSARVAFEADEKVRIGMTAIVYTLSADEEETVSENNPENEETGEETGEDMQFEDLSMEGTRPGGEKERTKGKSSQGE